MTMHHVVIRGSLICHISSCEMPLCLDKIKAQIRNFVQYSAPPANRAKQKGLLLVDYCNL